MLYVCLPICVVTTCVQTTPFLTRLSSSLCYDYLCPNYPLLTRFSSNLCREYLCPNYPFLTVCIGVQVATGVLQLLSEWSDTFPYDFRDERVMAQVRVISQRCIQANQGQSRSTEVMWG